MLSVQAHNFQVVYERRRGDKNIAYIQIVTGEFSSGEELAALIGDTLLNGKNAS